MAPRRAAAVSAATSITNSAAGPSKSQPATPSKGDVSQEISRGRKNQNGRQLAISSSTSSLPFVPSEPLSPIISRLRKMWKFAAVCQFLFTFDEAFGMSGFETEALERDLDGTETKVIPDLMRRLLYTLTLNRNIDEYNWEDHLREQYLARHPDQSILGTVDAPFPWAGLPLRQKIETLHQACEWQLWDAEKFRKLVKNEEDSHIWRIDPVGWDAKNNTYWLFDDNRLWIQHPPPEPVMAKAPPKKNSKKAKLEAAAVKRAAAAAQKRKREEAKPKSTPTRASARNRTSSGATETPVLKRVRTSRRSTGRDDWEEIPPGLLYNGVATDNDIKGEDGESELSDPPPAEEDEDVSMMDSVKAEESEVQTAEASAMEVEDSKAPDEVNGVAEENESLDNEKSVDVTEMDETSEEKAVIDDKKEEEPEWIEFETVAVTKQEWEAVSVYFAKSKHPDEKLLHQFLNAEVLPKVMADIAEVEKQKAHEAAMANRKRSSRIALKESEREEKERDRVARLKMEEKMAAIRAEESQKLAKEREEMDQAKVREERLREREERMAAREREAFERAEKEIFERENRERMREMRKLKREQVLANGGLVEENEEMQQHKEEDEDSWELNCEVCGKAGINLDDTEEIVCCEKCLIWQHTDCWNAFDRQLDRAKRDWENVDFYCTKCKPPAAGEPWPPAVAKRRQQEEAARVAREQQERAQMSQRVDVLPHQGVPMQQLHYQQRPSQYYSQSTNPQQYYQQQASQQQTYPHQSPQQQYPQQLSHQHHPQQQYAQSPYPPQQQYTSQHQRLYQAAPQQIHHSSQHSMQTSAAPINAPIYHGQYVNQPSVQYNQSQVSQYPQQWQQPSPPAQMQRSMHVAYSSSPNSGNGNAVEYYQRPMMMTQHNQITPQHMQRPVPQPHFAQHQSPAQQSITRQMSPQYGTQQPQRSPSFTLQSHQVSQGAQQSPPRSEPQISPISSAFNETRMDMPAPHAPIAAASNTPASNVTASSITSVPSETAQAAMSKPNDTIALRRDEASTLQPIKVTERALSEAPSSTSAQSSSSNQVKPLPTSPKVSPGLQRNSSNQPSGSFPLRYATARSPLSRPNDYNSPSAPTLSLGPSVHRATSPSPKSHQRTTSNLGKQDPLFNRQSVTLNQTSSNSSGPGPFRGSLARVSQASKSPTQSRMTATISQDSLPTMTTSGVVPSPLPPAQQQVSVASSQLVPQIEDSSKAPSSTAHQGQSNGISDLTHPIAPNPATTDSMTTPERTRAASILPSLSSEAPAT